MDLPRNEDYSKPEYWERRYISEDEYEWLGGFQCYKSILQKYLSKHQQSDSILQLGCGNSSFSTDLRNEGWANITNIDISLTGLQKLRRRERDSNYILMDMSLMPFTDKAFDVVVEKCTLDSLLVSAESPWDLDSTQHKLVGRVLKEIKRILNPGGTFISITFSQPHFRVPLLLAEGLGWSVQVEKIEGVGLHSYVFIIQDGDPAPARTKYLHSSSLVIQHNSDWESSDEEKFLENLNLDSDQEEDNSSS